MPTLDIPGHRVEYEEAGSGPRTWVLVHGNFASPRWWRPLMRWTPPGVRLLAPVLRGFGGGRGEQVDVELLAADLRAFVERLELAPFHLVGHSLGGAVAMEFALRCPERLRSLVLVAPAPGDAMESMRARSGVLRWIDPGHAGTRLALGSMMTAGRVFGTHRLALERALGQMMPFADPAEVDFAGLLDDAVALDTKTVLAVYEALSRWDVRAHLPRLGLPVEVLGGRRDGLVDAKDLEALARQLPRARLSLWDEVGHSPMLEKPRAFARWLDDVTLAREPWWRRLQVRLARLFSRPRPQLVSSS